MCWLISRRLAGTDENLAHEIIRAINRVRSLLVQIHPAPERVVKGTVLDLLIRYRGPAGLSAAGKSGVKRYATIPETTSRP